MKFDFNEEWCKKAADLEEGYNVSAGVPMKISFDDALDFLCRYTKAWSSLDELMSMECFTKPNPKESYIRLYDSHGDYDRFIMAKLNDEVEVIDGRLWFEVAEEWYPDPRKAFIQIIPLEEVLYENNV